MKKVDIIMENNWTDKVNMISMIETKPGYTLISVHAEYLPKRNETHITLYFETKGD